VKISFASTARRRRRSGGKCPNFGPGKQGRIFGEFGALDGLLATGRGKAFHEVFGGGVAFDMVDESLDRKRVPLKQGSPLRRFGLIQTISSS